MHARSLRALLAGLAVIALLAALFVRSRERGSDRADRPGGSVEPAPPSSPPPLAIPPSDRASPRGPEPVAKGAETAPPAPSTEIAAPKLRVHGRVITDSRTGDVGVGVEVRGWSADGRNTRVTTVATRTGTAGAFEVEIERAAVAGGFVVVTDGEGLLEAFRSVKLADFDEVRGIDVEVEAARSISGRVVDAAGEPLFGATVQLWYGSETTWPTNVGADGRFRTPARGPRRAFELIVEVPDFPRRVVPLPATTLETTDVGDLVFRRGGTLAGVVVDRRGEPVEDVPVRVQQAPSVSDQLPSTRTDARGRFEFTDLGLGTVSVFIEEPFEGGPPGARRSYRGGVGPVEVGRRDVRLVADTECVLVLRFVDADSGEPMSVRHARYGARTEGTPMPESLGAGAESTDPFPSVRTTVGTGRRYDVTVRVPEFEDAEVRGIDVRDLAEMTIDVRLRRKR